jgi:polar amino acid transport system permease protein
MLTQILSGVTMTLQITFLSLALGAVLGVPLAAARRSRIAALRTVATAYLDVVRAIPPITWLFLIYFGLPQYAIRLDSVTAAVLLGFSVIASAYMAEIYRSGLLSIPVGQWEAAHALGMGSSARTVHVITPQAFRVSLPAVAVYAIGMLKDSALASAVGVHEVTYQAGLTARSTHQGLLAFSIAGLVYIAMSIPLAVASRRVDLTLRTKLGVA